MINQKTNLLLECYPSECFAQIAERFGCSEEHVRAVLIHGFEEDENMDILKDGMRFLRTKLELLKEEFLNAPGLLTELGFDD